MDEGLDRIVWNDNVDALSHYPDLELRKNDVLWMCQRYYFIPFKCMSMLISRGASMRTFFTDDSLGTMMDRNRHENMRSEHHTELIQMCILQGAPITKEALIKASEGEYVEVASLLLQLWSLPKELIKFNPCVMGVCLASSTVPKLLIEHGFPVLTKVDAYNLTFHREITDIDKILTQHWLLCHQVKQECTHIVWCLKQHDVSKDIIKDMLIYIWEIKIKPYR